MPKIEYGVRRGCVFIAQCVDFQELTLNKEQLFVQTIFGSLVLGQSTYLYY